MWFHSKPIPCPFPSHHKTSQQMKIAESHASKPVQQLVRHLCSIISSFSIQMCTTENSAVFYDCFPFFAFFHSFFDIDLPNFFFARFWLDLIYVNCFFFNQFNWYNLVNGGIRAFFKMILTNDNRTENILPLYSFRKQTENIYTHTHNENEEWDENNRIYEIEFKCEIKCCFAG